MMEDQRSFEWAVKQKVLNVSCLYDGQILGSIGSVGGGLALGKEGPLVHTGACIASVLGQVNDLNFFSPGW